VAHLPHLLASCTRHRLTEAVAALWSGWRQLEEDLYRSHAQNLPEKVYLAQRIFKWSYRVTVEVPSGAENAVGVYPPTFSLSFLP